MQTARQDREGEKEADRVILDTTRRSVSEADHLVIGVDRPEGRGAALENVVVTVKGKALTLITAKRGSVEGETGMGVMIQGIVTGRGKNMMIPPGEGTKCTRRTYF